VIKGAAPVTAGKPPVVSIGLPVYNGARHLAESIESLLAQTFIDFELIISDNASTDETETICRAYAARDQRIRYVRQPENLGSARNWNFVVDLARGEYFKWASANDLCAPQMLEHCVEVMRSEPDVVLCYGRTQLIDDEGKIIQVYPHDLEVLEARPSTRFRRLCLELRLNNGQSGLHRLATLRRTGVERNYPTGDTVLAAELALHGRFRRLSEVQLNRRMGRHSASRYLTPRELRIFLGAKDQEVHRVVWLTHGDYFRSVLRAPIGVLEKLSALAFVLRSVWWHRVALWRELRAHSDTCRSP